MKSITVDKAKLRETVQKNRDGHRAVFDEAVEGYRRTAVEKLEEHIERIKEGKVQVVQVYLPAPTDHTKDYDRILAMLDMEVADTIEIGESDVMQYVQDEWPWKNEFLNTSASYGSTTANSILNS